MVVSLGPGKFYGGSLPRPRIYTDVKLNPVRVDPPVPVTDPLLSWAREAHWSMGGLGFQRLRLQGRIEGNANRLRQQKEKQAKLQSPKVVKGLDPDGGNGKRENKKKRVGSVSPPPAPKASKRRRLVDLFDDDSEEEEEEDGEEVVEKAEIGGGRKTPVRKLVGEFDRVAKESEASKNAKIGDDKTRRITSEQIGGGVGDAVMKVVEKVNRENSEKKQSKGGKMGKFGRKIVASVSLNGLRTSPRLAKQSSS